MSFLRHVLSSIACAAACALDHVAHPGLTLTLGPLATAKAFDTFQTDDPAIVAALVAHALECNLEELERAQAAVPPSPVPGISPVLEAMGAEIERLRQEVEALRGSLMIHQSKSCVDVHAQGPE